MVIPKKLLEEWSLLHSNGDALKIADISGLHPETIRRALRSGRACDELVAILKEYYDNKKNLIDG